MDGERNTIVTTNVINLIAGIWLFLFPILFGFVGTAFAMNAYILGIVVAILSLVRIFSPMESGWAGWLNGILGLWLLISPLFLVGLTTGAVWNNILVGLVVIVMAVWSATTTTMTHGHPKMG